MRPATDADTPTRMGEFLKLVMKIQGNHVQPNVPDFRLRWPMSDETDASRPIV